MDKTARFGNRHIPVHGIKESSMSKLILRVIKLEVGNMVALVRKMGKP